MFKGDQHHSADHPGPDAYAGKKAVVIGSNNSAHDICAALWEHGADVTMVQRTSTHIVRSDTLMDIGLGALYSQEAVESGVTTEKADLIFASLPYRIMHEFQIPLYDQMRERDADYYERLEDAGFDLDWGEDNSGLFMKYLRRGSGYYIDVGASELVADGKIKLQNGQVDHLSEDAVVMEDGTELPADLVVFATGYSSMNGFVADLVSQGWPTGGQALGVGSERKIPGLGGGSHTCGADQAEGLWFHGATAPSRHYSPFLEHSEARKEGIDPRYNGLQESTTSVTGTGGRRATRPRRHSSALRRPPRVADRS